MSIHVEWMDAGATSAEFVEAGEEVIEGDEESVVPEGEIALVLSADDVMVLSSTPEGMRAFLQRLIDAVPDAWVIPGVTPTQKESNA